MTSSAAENQTDSRQFIEESQAADKPAKEEIRLIIASIPTYQFMDRADEEEARAFGDEKAKRFIATNNTFQNIAEHIEKVKIREKEREES